MIVAHPLISTSGQPGGEVTGSGRSHYRERHCLAGKKWSLRQEETFAVTSALLPDGGPPYAAVSAARVGIPTRHTRAGWKSRPMRVVLWVRAVKVARHLPPPMTVHKGEGAVEKAVPQCGVPCRWEGSLPWDEHRAILSTPYGGRTLEDDCPSWARRVPHS